MEPVELVAQVFDLVRELFVRVKLAGAVEQGLGVFLVVRIRQTALHRAHRLAGFVVVECNALGAQSRIDDVDVVALADRLVRALGLAGTAVDALFCDVGGHTAQSSCLTPSVVALHEHVSDVLCLVPDLDSSSSSVVYPTDPKKLPRIYISKLNAAITGSRSEHRHHACQPVVLRCIYFWRVTLKLNADIR